MSWDSLLVDSDLKIHLKMQDNAANNDVLESIAPSNYDLVQSSVAVDTSTRSFASGVDEPFAAWWPRYLEKVNAADKIQNPSTGALASGFDGFSVCGWTKTPQSNTTAVLLFGHMANSGSTNRTFSIYADNGAAADGGRLYMLVQSTDGASIIKNYTTNDRIFLGEVWVHWCITYHSTNGLKVYIDGTEYTNLTKTTDLAAQSPYSGNARFTVGGQYFGSDNTTLGTAFCDFRCYTRELTAAEVNAIYSGPAKIAKILYFYNRLRKK